MSLSVPTALGGSVIEGYPCFHSSRSMGCRESLLLELRLALSGPANSRGRDSLKDWRILGCARYEASLYALDLKGFDQNHDLPGSTNPISHDASKVVLALF